MLPQLGHKCVVTFSVPKTTFYRPQGGKFVGDVDLHFDADRMLFSSVGTHGRWNVFEIRADGTDDPKIRARLLCQAVASVEESLAIRTE